ncbi:Rare lipoprotein A [Gluconacetobacter diazotrophicus PA1 5]|uniref:SPOR domain-containing protein n=3 Tax=Gluconacetobacter diazotrophicus TaxID=33996 RepID=A0A7W4FDU7_GLUDI|nr:Rare lipoprotein A [Gluconacetobacter diazotrophicus PA1 5]MBB2155847.1 SPOR domain-containing protein [Gluconacetobacter diazotrophicus]TWB10324.1 rare lipoprotein A [Gluconacetobacter diazotrophicus]CAP55739.1 putative rare lipoprotein A precursor [Gluconacetobacter diazotrophicus PA1 5]
MAALGLLGCHRAEPGLPPAAPHYVVGAPYQMDGVWYYPHEDFSYQATGLAVADPDRTPYVTADGEHYSPDALTGRHATLQLPAIVTVRNLENGREITIRVNDRGPDSPGRLIGLSPRAAALLGIGSNPVRVAVTGLEAQNEQLAEGLPGTQHLDIAAAPAGQVRAESLDHPGSGATIVGAPGGTVGAADISALMGDLPPSVRQGYVVGGLLWVDAGTFSTLRYAELSAARTGGRVVPVQEHGRALWRVHVGPFMNATDADRALDQLMGAGVTGARIVVE